MVMGHDGAAELLGEALEGWLLDGVAVRTGAGEEDVKVDLGRRRGRPRKPLACQRAQAEAQDGAAPTRRYKSRLGFALNIPLSQFWTARALSIGCKTRKRKICSWDGERSKNKLDIPALRGRN